ncbi:nucleotide sugar dehydrogenase [uncultured Salinibacterium sp.]|uniref:nucleotide sugar dehydrogenase n=1 Tax=uncultured Salinibacterium sp. TaxID=459274 RepID=UPI0030D938E5|tara:strand:+ start:27272 stop:28567 length:1296 start_codon:yes stop_codon:yes gene_type:complete
MKIAVIALGKIGLPLAVQFASKGHSVVGVDISERTVSLVNQGVAPFPGETNLDALLAEVVADGRLTATSRYEDAVPTADAVVIVVPLLVDNEARPEFAALDSATRSIAAHLSAHTLVAYETTLPVGTTRTRWKPLLEKGSGLTEGTDFDLVFSPERVLTGRVFADLRKYPKLIGGFSAAGAQKATDFYNAVLDFDDRPDLPRANGVWNLDSVEAAEFAKLAETTYRDVNIGLANQFARFADNNGIDIAKVIDASNSQPYSHIHRPGIAVGGHCIPVYPRLYLWNDPDASIVRAAREANASMPSYAVGVAEGAYGNLKDARVAVLGAAYRGGVKESAFSGVFPTVEALLARGATVLVHDPLFDDEELVAMGFEPYHLGDPVNLAIIQADHAAYRELRSADLPGISALVDGRRITDPAHWLDVVYRVIGGGTL